MPPRPGIRRGGGHPYFPFFALANGIAKLKNGGDNMIQFFLTRGHTGTLTEVKKSPLAPVMSLKHYDALFRATGVRRATQVFADLDRLSYWDLELAADLYLQMKEAGLQVFNNPARFKNRYTLLRALHTAGLNDFDAYRIHEIDAIKRFPVFLRKIQGHRAPLTGWLETAAETRRAVAGALAAGTPEENLVLIEVVAEPIRPGLYRKHSATCLGQTIVPRPPLHDKGWLVKYGQTLALTEDELRAEHAELEQNPFAEQLRQVFDIAGVEYGRADFGFYQGRLQVFEINTNPSLDQFEEEDPSVLRRASMRLGWEKHMAGLRAMDSQPGGRIRLTGGKLQRHRVWKNLLVRSRQVH